METQRQYLFSIICLNLILSSVATKCEWFEYHDDIMDDCGPCEEICKGVLSRGKVIIGTEKQCNHQCSDFLASKNCTYTEYYDHVIHSCAPCYEMCDHSEIRGTTCPLQCNMYLKAKNCTQEEYFKIDNSMCSPCSDLCHYNETKGTAKECFDKCPEYVEKNHPGNVMLEPLDLDTDSSSRPSRHSQANSSVHPVVITVLVVGIVALVILPVAVYRCRAFKVKARRQDMATRSTAGYVAVRTPVQQASSLNLTEPRTNSADNDFNVSMNSGLTQDDGNVGNSAMEMHILAPSTSTAQPSPWQSARVMNV